MRCETMYLKVCVMLLMGQRYFSQALAMLRFTVMFSVMQELIMIKKKNNHTITQKINYYLGSRKSNFCR